MYVVIPTIIVLLFIAGAILLFYPKSKEEELNALKYWTKGYDRKVGTEVFPGQEYTIIDYDTCGYVVIDRPPVSRNMNIHKGGKNPYSVTLQLTGDYTETEKGAFVCELVDIHSFITHDFLGETAYSV